MSQVIAGEAAFFLASFATGIGILFGYDILRGFRRGVPHSGRIISVQDFLYWCAAGIMVFYTAYRENRGNIRGFAVAALLLGMLVYYQVASSAVVRLLSFLFSHIYKGVVSVFLLLLSPAGKSAKKTGKIVRKILKNRIKEVRILLRKK